MPLDDRVIDQVASELGRYVYVLVDPRDSRPFYVGKGQGLRFLSHDRAVPETLDEDEGPKAARIRSIRQAKADPEIWILRYGLSQAEYTAVEGAAIDLLMSFPIVPASTGAHRPLERPAELTNARRESSRGHGIVLLDRLIDDFAAPVLTADVPLLLITLGAWTDHAGEVIAGGRTRYGAGFKRAWYDPVLRAAEIGVMGAGMSAWWKVSPRHVEREGIEHAVALYRGITRGVFRIEDGSWEKNSDGRAAFWCTPITTGSLYDEVVGPHGHRVPNRAKGAQNSIYYWPR